MQISKFSHVPEDCHVLEEHVRRRRESRSQPGSHDGRASVAFSVFRQNFTVFGSKCRFATGPTMSLIKGSGWRVILAVLVAFTWTSAASYLHADEYYMRLGVGLERMDDSIFLDTDCQQPLYGCGTTGLIRQGNTGRSTGGYNSDPVLEIGFGYDTGSAVRVEILIDYRPEINFTGHSNYNLSRPGARQSADINLSSVSTMLAAYMDLNHIGFPEMGTARPFIGAGVGIAQNKVTSKTLLFDYHRTIVPGGSRTDLAWMITAGYSVPLDHQLTLDVAWRHTDLGEARTGKGKGLVDRYNPERIDIPLNLLPTWTRLKGQGIHISLRRSF